MMTCEDKAYSTWEHAGSSVRTLTTALTAEEASASDPEALLLNLPYGVELSPIYVANQVVTCARTAVDQGRCDPSLAWFLSCGAG